jgi:hypothetical protein
LWRWEETSNVAVIRGFRRWIESKGVQRKLGRLMSLIGVRRAFIVSWDGKPRWVIVPFEDWANDAKEDVA